MPSFPNTSLYTMELANIFCGMDPSVPDADLSNHLALRELKLPGITENYVDHVPGGSPFAIEIDTHLVRLECTFSLLGWSPQTAKLIAAWSSNQNRFFVYGAIRDRTTGTSYKAEAIMKGRLGLADPQNWRRGDPGTWNYSIRGIVAYELTMGGDEIYNWDFSEHRFQVGGGLDSNLAVAYANIMARLAV